jgi:hypothetical protein
MRNVPCCVGPTHYYIPREEHEASLPSLDISSDGSIFLVLVLFLHLGTGDRFPA